MKSELLSISLLLLIFICTVHGGKKMFCYYSSDAQYRRGPAKFIPEKIDPFLCTHIILAFFQPTEDGLSVRSVQWNDLGQRGLYARTVALKETNKDLRVLLAIGGWVIGSKPFVNIIKNRHTMTTFAKNVVQFLREHRMDGMDMDWEFPGVRGSIPADKSKFTLFLKTLQDEFRRESFRTGSEKLILTLATAAGSYYIDQGYETTEVVKYPDYLLLMTYNYHGSWENVTGHHSSVYSSHLDTGSRRELNMKWTVDFWLSKGAPRDKLILGLATYGMTFQLKNPAIHGVLAPAYGGGRGAQYTNEYGIMAYFEVCENLAQHGWTKVWLDDQKSPYAFGGDQWVGYDDPESLRIKVETMINGYNLAGAFVWSVEMDDFNGLCGEGPYPLLHAIISSMDGGISIPVSIPSPTVRPTFRPVTPRPTYRPQTTPRPNFGTTTEPSIHFPSTNCNYLGVGIFKDPNNCGQFFFCVSAVEGKFIQYGMSCPARTSFDKHYLNCVYDSNCNRNGIVPF